MNGKSLQPASWLTPWRWSRGRWRGFAIYWLVAYITAGAGAFWYVQEAGYPQPEETIVCVVFFPLIIGGEILAAVLHFIFNSMQ